MLHEVIIKIELNQNRVVRKNPDSTVRSVGLALPH